MGKNGTSHEQSAIKKIIGFTGPYMSNRCMCCLLCRREVTVVKRCVEIHLHHHVRKCEITRQEKEEFMRSLGIWVDYTVKMTKEEVIKTLLNK